jgi:hypothetical protein
MRDRRGRILALCKPDEPWSPRRTQDAIRDIHFGLHRYLAVGAGREAEVRRRAGEWEDVMAWSLQGTYVESGNCEAACPCVFLGAPTQGECTLLAAWHVDKGGFDNVKLDGLNVALAVHSGHMAKTKWNAAVYIDEKASSDQEQSLGKIFGGQAGGHPAVLASFVGKLLGVKKVPIQFTQSGKSFSLKMPNVAEMSIEAMQGAGGADVQIAGHPLCIAPGFPATVGRSTQLKYTDHGMSWNLSQKNAFYSHFEYKG